MKRKEVDAVQWTGDLEAIRSFTGYRAELKNETSCIVSTPEGPMFLLEWDWVVKGRGGKLKLMHNDIFRAKYKLKEASRIERKENDDEQS